VRKKANWENRKEGTFTEEGGQKRVDEGGEEGNRDKLISKNLNQKGEML
jgi:hypothetical protein